MSENNCICHFCGYEIKDAKARARIEQLTQTFSEYRSGFVEEYQRFQGEIAEDFTAAENAMKSYADKSAEDAAAAVKNYTDAKIAESRTGYSSTTEKMTHVSGGSNLTKKEVTIRDIRYNKSAGMVFACLSFAFAGFMVTGESVTFTKSEGDKEMYLPIATIPYYPLTVMDANSNTLFRMAAYVNNNGVTIKALENIDTGENGEIAVMISGWYTHNE